MAGLRDGVYFTHYNDNFDIRKYMEEKHDPRPFGLALPHLDPELFSYKNHESEYPYRLNIPMGWGFRDEDAYKIYRKHAIGYCDPREDLERFARADASKIDGYVAIAFEDDIGMFWFHFPYITCCVVDTDTLEEAEDMFTKCNVYKSSDTRWENKLKAQQILDGGWAWQAGIDFRGEPLCLDRATRLDSGAWINER